MKKACIIVGILLLCLLVGCKENITIQIQISDKIVINKQEKIILTENGKEIEDKLQWTISNYDVAEINDGILYAKTVGTVIISTVYNQNIYTKELEVIEPYVEDIIIDGKTEVIIGRTIKLKASVVPDIIKSEVVWESEDANIASVNNGVVKGIRIGAVNIIVRCDNFQKKYLIDVIDYPSSLEISIEKELG
ncbi:MAG: Ig-like domain-containing protein, partial [Bacilli bacterium]|nr:Ig-like domain-containing protein [Bacilli bacterium]